MAKRIVWTKEAQNDRREILNYWNNRNKSKTYSIKLNNLIISSIKLIAYNPNIGMDTNIPNVKIKTLKDYFIIYKNSEASILILGLGDTRRNPTDFNKKFS
jgi:toxin YoeB